MWPGANLASGRVVCVNATEVASAVKSTAVRKNTRTGNSVSVTVGGRNVPIPNAREPHSLKACVNPTGVGPDVRETGVPVGVKVVVYVVLMEVDVVVNIPDVRRVRSVNRCVQSMEDTVRVSSKIVFERIEVGVIVSSIDKR